MIFVAGFVVYLIGYVGETLSRFDPPVSALFWGLKVSGVIVMLYSLLTLAWRHLP